jgi:pilus assembly protein CpaF
MSEYSTEEKRSLFDRIHATIFGYDIIQPLLDMPEVSEIMINGPRTIFYETKGALKKSDIAFDGERHLMQLIHKISTEVGREINISHPILDARLRDGSRVNVILDPIALNGPIITIRKFKKALSNSRELMQSGMFSQNLFDLFETLIRCKYNLFICGSTGSGKTTLLNCLSSFIDANERIVTIEDASEISLSNHQNVVTLEARKAKQNQLEVSMSQLIKNALRMRPDRIIVGEVRGDEVIDMLQAMNTGHDGSLSTGHSNSAIDMLTRLEVIASSYSDINHLLIRKQIISAIDFIIFVEKRHDGTRKVTQVSEVLKSTNDYTLNPIYDYDLNEPFDGRSAPLKMRIKSQSKLRRYYDQRTEK